MSQIGIRKVSRDSAPDIDGWIIQAKQLHVDIQKSQEIAREIVEQARQGELLERKLDDASNKVGLLNGELAFSKSLGATLEKLQAIRKTFDDIQQAIFAGRLLEAVNLIGQVEDGLESIPVPRSTRVASVFSARVADLRNDVVERLMDRWKVYICVDLDRSLVKISHTLGGRVPALSSSDPELITFQTLLQWTYKHWWLP